MRMRLVPEITNWDFFGRSKLWLGISALMMVVAFVSFLLQGLNYGIDFRGGTTIRTESPSAVDVGAYRDALQPLELGDITISEVFDPSFGDDRNVAMIRVQAQDDQEAVSADLIAQIEAALSEVAPDITFASVESVGPKVSGELIQTAVIAVLLAIGAVLIYIWLRFEWQFAVGAVLALVGVCFAYGFFHAVGPGHGKLLIGGYGLSHRVPLGRLTVISLLSSLGQALSAIVLVLSGLFLLDWTRSQLTDTAEKVMLPLSTLAIGLIGGWLALRGARKLWRLRRDQAHAHHGCTHRHGPTPEELRRAGGLRDALVLIAGIAAVIVLVILLFGEEVAGLFDDTCETVASTTSQTC